MQNAQPALLQLACLYLLQQQDPIFSHTFKTHGVVTENDILNLPIEDEDDEITMGLHCLSSNLATDMDDNSHHITLTPTHELCYNILSSVHS